MDITDTRRSQLRKLIDERFHGRIARLAEAIERAPGYISRVLSGDKGIGEVLCRDVEDRLGLPSGWLDDHQDVAPNQIDSEALYECTVAVDAAGGSDDSKQRLRLACLLYAIQRSSKGNRAAGDVQSDDDILAIIRKLDTLPASARRAIMTIINSWDVSDEDDGKAVRRGGRKLRPATSSAMNHLTSKKK